MNKIVSILIVTLLIVSGCALNDSVNIEEYVEVSDDGSMKLTSVNKSNVKLDYRPQKIVSLDNFYTDALTYLGFYPVGATTDSDSSGELPYYVKETLSNEGTANLGEINKINFENLEKLQPDLILATTKEEDIYEDLNSIAPTVIWNVNSIEDGDLNGWEETFMEIGELLNKEDEVDKFLVDYNKRLDEVNALIEKNYKNETVLFLNKEEGMNGENDSYTLIYQTFLYDDLNFSSSVFDELDGGGDFVIQDMDFESLMGMNPDYLIVATDTRLDLEKLVESEPQVVHMKAYKNENIYEVDPSLWSNHTGPIGHDLQLNQIESFLDKNKDSVV